MSFEEYQRKPPSAQTQEKLAPGCNNYNLYVFTTGLFYEWSRRHRKTMVHVDGCLNDETFTPIHLQLAGFEPHFYIKFPDNGNYSEQQKIDYLDSLDEKLRTHLRKASAPDAPNTAANKLAQKIFGFKRKTSTFTSSTSSSSYAAPITAKNKKRKREQDEQRSLYDGGTTNYERANSILTDGGGAATEEPTGSPDAPFLFQNEDDDQEDAYDRAELAEENDVIRDELNDTVNFVRLVTGYKHVKRMPITPYQELPDDMYDVSLVHPKLVKEIRDLIIADDPALRIFDVTTDFIIRYLADNQMYPCSWFRLTRGTYYQLGGGGTQGGVDTEKYTRAEIHEYFVPNYTTFVHVNTQLTETHFVKTLDPHETLASTKDSPSIAEYYKKHTKHLATLIPNIRVLCFDTEEKTDGTRFPDEKKDPVILIQMEVYGLFSQKKEGGIQTAAISLGDVEPIATVQKTYCVDREKDMLQLFYEFVRKSDPDIIVHHNGNGHDFKYLFARAKHYGLNHFQYLGRTDKASAYRNESESKGWKKSTVSVPCRMNFDLLRFAQEFVPAFEECKLDFLGNLLLKSRKEELLPDMLAKYHETTKGRTKILVYGMKDVVLTRRIEQKLKGILDTFEISRAVAIPFQTCVDRAQGSKMEAKLYQYMNSSRHGDYRYVFEFKSKRYDNHKQTDGESSAKKARTDTSTTSSGKQTFMPNTPSRSFAYLDNFAQAQKKEKAKLAKPIGSSGNSRVKKALDAAAKDPSQSKLSFASTSNTSSNSTNTTSPFGKGLQEAWKPATVIDREKKDKKKKDFDDTLAQEEQEGYDGAAVLTSKGGLYGFIDYEFLKRFWGGKNEDQLRSINANLPPHLADSTSSTWDGVKKQLHYRFSHPVATLDFAAMYPSIIRLHNLCFSTLLTDELIAKHKMVEGVHYWRRPDYVEDKATKKVNVVPNPKGPAFVLPSVRRGLLPLIEDELAAERTAVKNQKKVADNQISALLEKLKKLYPEDILSDGQAPDHAFFYENRKQCTAIPAHELDALLDTLDDLETVSAVLETRQNKIKGIMNSIYGLTGDPTNKFYCKKIAETVTAKGRSMIYIICFEAETRYTRANGCPFDAEVIGGDTDSIFVYMKGLGLIWVRSESLAANDPYRKQEYVTDLGLEGTPVLYLKEAFEWGVRMAAELTKLFENPCKLEFEKLITNHNNIKAKNYFGVKWMLDKNSTHGDPFMKGLQAKKRGLPKFVKDTAKECIKLIGLGSDIQKAVSYARARVDKLVRGDVSIVELSLVQKLSKNPLEYTTNPPAVVLARKRIKRDKTDKIEAGEIIKYVLVNYNRVYHDRKKDVRRSDQAMEPLEAMQKGYPLDLELYKDMIDNQLFKIFYYPLRRILVEPHWDTDLRRGHLFPNLTLDSKEECKAAVLKYIYGSTDALMNYRNSIAPSEIADRGSIVYFCRLVYCVACGKSMRTASDDQLEICVECRPLLKRRRKTIKKEKRALKRESKEIWTKCDECMQGNVDDAQDCMNMSCVVRGDRHIIDSKLDKIRKRLATIDTQF